MGPTSPGYAGNTEGFAAPIQAPGQVRSYGGPLLFLALSALYTLGYQSAYWSDGRPLLDLVARGSWVYHHLAYLPVAQLFYRALQPVFGMDPERSLALLSALASAAAVWGVWRAARSAGLGTRSALGAALFLATTPSVIFYATTIEVHPLQLLVSALGLNAAVREWRSERERPDALLPAVLAVALVATHTVGVLALPCLALFALRRGGRWQRPRRLAPALILLLLAGLGWWLSLGESEAVSGRAHAALLGTLAKWSPSFLLSEWAKWCSVVSVLAAVAGVKLWRSRAQSRDLLLYTSAIVLPFLIVLPGWQVAERGGYLTPLLPLLALGAAFGLRAVGTKQHLLALCLCAFQAVMGVREIRAWTAHYRGAEWIEAFKQQAGGKGLLLALDNWEMQSLRLHSRLEASSLRVMRKKREIELDIQLPGVFEGIAFAVASTRAQGGLVAMTSSLYDLARERPDIRAFIEKLEAREGRLVPSAHAEYMLFPELQ